MRGRVDNQSFFPAFPHFRISSFPHFLISSFPHFLISFCIHGIHDLVQIGSITKTFKLLCGKAFPHFRISTFPHFCISSFPHFRISAFPHFLISSFPHGLCRISAFPHFLMDCAAKKAVAHLSKIKCGAAFPKRGAPLIKKEVPHLPIR